MKVKQVINKEYYYNSRSHLLMKREIINISAPKNILLMEANINNSLPSVIEIREAIEYLWLEGNWVFSMNMLAYLKDEWIPIKDENHLNLIMAYDKI
ncbi:MAG: hypothetical protein R3321_14275 [Nitrososphaeraceae archaeon]|nr:hypothetical protein [Nitrososphaeraceae archaeon]